MCVYTKRFDVSGVAYAARIEIEIRVDCGMMGFYRVRRQYNTESVLQSTSDSLRCVFKL